jgi:queuine tRNA-ribosyltransferase
LRYPQDVLHAVRFGIDLYDCVLPARNARHGVLFTRGGLLRIRNARFRMDGAPPDPAVAATVHNLSHYLDFMEDLRQAIRSGTLAESVAALALGASGELPQLP